MTRGQHTVNGLALLTLAVGLEPTPAQPEHWWISYSPLWGILDQPEVQP